jgi:hypothetical protein
MKPAVQAAKKLQPGDAVVVFGGDHDRDDGCRRGERHRARLDQPHERAFVDQSRDGSRPGFGGTLTGNIEQLQFDPPGAGDCEASGGRIACRVGGNQCRLPAIVRQHVGETPAGKRTVAARDDLHARSGQPRQSRFGERPFGGGKPGVGRRFDAESHRFELRNRDDFNVVTRTARPPRAHEIARRRSDVRNRGAPFGAGFGKHRENLFIRRRWSRASFGGASGEQHEFDAVDSAPRGNHANVHSRSVDDPGVSGLNGERDAGIRRMIAVRIGKSAPFRCGEPGHAERRNGQQQGDRRQHQRRPAYRIDRNGSVSRDAVCQMRRALHGHSRQTGGQFGRTGIRAGRAGGRKFEARENLPPRPGDAVEPPCQLTERPLTRGVVKHANQQRHPDGGRETEKACPDRRRQLEHQVEPDTDDETDDRRDQAPDEPRRSVDSQQTPANLDEPFGETSIRHGR